jgi:dipeptidyl aminopeptidase/acylaminoacyl peptidase
MEQQVTFYSDGLKIAGALFEPDDVPEGSCPAIVMCQGMIGVKEYFWFPHIARSFVELGCVALIWDYRGVGSSEGEPGRLYPLEQAEDIRNALTYLETNPKVDASRLALFGMSFGGGMVPHVAGVDERVRCGISVVGWSNGERWMRAVRRHHEWLELLDRIEEDKRVRVLTGVSELLNPGEILVGDPSTDEERAKIIRGIPHMEGYSGTPYSLATAEKLLEFSPEDVVHRISPRAMLYIAAKRDTVTPCEDVMEMYHLTGEPKKLWVIPGEPHYAVYREPYFGQVMEMTIDWLREHLPLG